jgi:hypothetical protein
MTALRHRALDSLMRMMIKMSVVGGYGVRKTAMSRTRVPRLMMAGRPKILIPRMRSPHPNPDH